MAHSRTFPTNSEPEADETAQNVTTTTEPSVIRADVSMTEGDAEEKDYGAETNSSESSPKPPKGTGKAIVLRKHERDYCGSGSRFIQHPRIPTSFLRAFNYLSFRWIRKRTGR